MAFNSSSAAPLHPYYPLGVEIVGYMANEWNTFELVSMFAAGCAVIFSITYAVLMKSRPNASNSDVLIMMWFVLCGCIHLFFEGYFAYNFRRMGGMQDLFGQLWKEYALSDSRYLTQDAFVLCMETVTAAFWGPLSFVTAYLIAVDHPLRYSLQLIVSLGQFYGDVLYYATSLFDHYILDVAYTRPEAAYYWGYFVLMNFFWIAVPGYLMYQSVDASVRAFRAVNDASKLLQKAQQMGYYKKKA
ncbi:3-beta-hydroxysteroid-Delta(8),Delta(7)-isomerase [Macroventuria anomochaeta]|uniref:3-beta-hydroxysteroid-Delta(8), Delta(7)-isomerase n=1 Tax=Macroventuria anomochaeta TaxID=301207 RepID=A0ACB6RI76_9PLEO|nr:3-beta-hydroxysteroid-Delta(8),Delta(7)-isomerase [Macroventuria anomochaeta]KAF2621448.1 3-beta-hydroxysteroid-Delta(8),Delta(7)-isomerase [Macroventuria anomochaeta]